MSDHQGSVRDVIDNSGTVLNHIVYDSFGQVTSESDPSFDFCFGYTCRKLDEETGMMCWAQDFDPAVRIGPVGVWGSALTVALPFRQDFRAQRFCWRR